MGRPTLAANQRGPPRAPWARPTPRFWAQPKPLLTSELVIGVWPKRREVDRSHRAFDPLATVTESHLHQAMDVRLLRFDLFAKVGRHATQFGDQGFCVRQLLAQVVRVESASYPMQHRLAFRVAPFMQKFCSEAVRGPWPDRVRRRSSLVAWAQRAHWHRLRWGRRRCRIRVALGRGQSHRPSRPGF